jgi:small conductance mechanosensitive channel
MGEISTDLTFWQSFALSALYAAALLAAGWFASNFVRSLFLRVARSRKLDEAVSRFLATLIQYIILAAAFIAALEKVGVDVISFVALLGTLGLAVGLALQGELSNFSSGVMLLVYRPFDIGDVITAGGHTGQVTEIGLFATRLSTPDKKVIIIPNAGVNSGSIINMTASGVRRGGVSVGVAYGADVQEIIGILEAAAGRIELVHSDPGPQVTFDNLGASSLDFTVYCSSDTENFTTMMGLVREAVYNDLNAAGVDIPYNQLVIHQAPPAS